MENEKKNADAAAIAAAAASRTNYMWHYFYIGNKAV